MTKKLTRKYLIVHGEKFLLSVKCSTKFVGKLILLAGGSNSFTVLDRFECPFGSKLLIDQSSLLEDCVR